jgi:hypothetical protein
MITDGKKKESWLFWRTKTVSRLPESVSLETAVSPKKGLSLLKVTSCPQGPSLAAFFPWKILQAVGSLVAKASGGPAKRAAKRIRIRAVK